MKNDDTKLDPPVVPGPAQDDSLDGEERFEQLAAELSALPASLEPDRDMWPDLASRLEPRPEVRRPVRMPVFRRIATHPAWRQAIAAGLGLVAGAVLTYLSMSAISPGAASSSDGTEAQIRLASVGTQSGSIDQAEMQFLRAKEELWLAVFERRGEMSPEAWEMVEQNLQILDGAVADLRAALADDPGNPALEKGILNNQRRSLDLLREVASGLSDSV